MAPNGTIFLRNLWIISKRPFIIPPMLEVIEKLLALQDRDQRRHTFETELAHLPIERTSREKQIANSAARLESAKTRVKEIEVEKKSLEVDAATKREAILRYRNQQLLTRKNEEFTALNHEIEAAEKVIITIEDKELELMEELETLKPEVAAAEKLHAEEKSKIEKILEGLDAKKVNLDSRLAELQNDRATFTAGIDEDVLERFERLFKTKGGVSVAPLEHDVCMGCHMKVTTQTVVQVKAAKEIVYCPQCGRSLYLAI
jgi:uncharacterized protein